MGRGRGAGRIIFTKNSDGTINIIEIFFTFSNSNIFVKISYYEGFSW